MGVEVCCVRRSAREGQEGDGATIRELQQRGARVDRVGVLTMDWSCCSWARHFVEHLLGVGVPLSGTLVVPLPWKKWCCPVAEFHRAGGALPPQLLGEERGGGPWSRGGRLLLLRLGEEERQGRSR